MKAPLSHPCAHSLPGGPIVSLDTRVQDHVDPSSFLLFGSKWHWEFYFGKQNVNKVIVYVLVPTKNIFNRNCILNSPIKNRTQIWKQTQSYW